MRAAIKEPLVPRTAVTVVEQDATSELKKVLEEAKRSVLDDEMSVEDLRIALRASRERARARREVAAREKRSEIYNSLDPKGKKLADGYDQLKADIFEIDEKPEWLAVDPKDLMDPGKNTELIKWLLEIKGIRPSRLSTNQLREMAGDGKIELAHTSDFAKRRAIGGWLITRDGSLFSLFTGGERNPGLTLQLRGTDVPYKEDSNWRQKWIDRQD